MNNQSIAANIIEEMRKWNKNGIKIKDAENRFYEESEDWIIMFPEEMYKVCQMKIYSPTDVAYFSDDSVALYHPLELTSGKVVRSEKNRMALINYIDNLEGG